MATPSEVVELKRQKTGTDLNTFDDVTLIKVGQFVPVKTLEEAKHRVGGDTEKFISIINEGLEAEAGRNLVNDPSVVWQVEDEEGTLSPFSGLLADGKTVGVLILNLAKSVFGYKKEATKEEKRAAKESAKDLIKNSEVMKAGLIKNAVSQ